MRIGLVSTCFSADALGPRYLSSYVKRAGHQVCLIGLTGKGAKDLHAPYAPALLAQVVDRLRDVDVIGVSLMTNTYYHAVAVSRAVRNAGLTQPIVWGGVHPTVAPDSCVEYADWLCIGEGERSLVSLADRLDAGQGPEGVAGIAVVRDGRVEPTAPWPLSDDLDDYPFPDFSLADEYVVRKGQLVAATPERIGRWMRRYRMLTTRGCPYQCTFCSNATFRSLYEDRGPWVRKRSVGNVIAELEAVVPRFEMIGAVKITDDLFFVRSEQEMAEFALAYADRVGLPFEVDAHPATMTRGKVQALVDAGLFRVNMGIQSGSQRTNYEIFNRPTSERQVAEAIDVLAEFPQVEAEYHYIVANPFEPEDQCIETIHFAAEHHRGHFKIDVFPLAFFPGTPLYERAIAEGVITGSQDELYGRVWRQSRTWRVLGQYMVALLALVLRLKRWGVSTVRTKRVISAALSRPVRGVLDRGYLPGLLAVAWVVIRLVRNVIYQPFIRPIVKLWRRVHAPSSTHPAGV